MCLEQGRQSRIRALRELLVHETQHLTESVMLFVRLVELESQLQVRPGGEARDAERRSHGRGDNSECLAAMRDRLDLKAATLSHDLDSELGGVDVGDRSELHVVAHSVARVIVNPTPGVRPVL